MVRRILRTPLRQAEKKYLQRKQSEANNRLRANTLDSNTMWKAARQTRTMKNVLGTLQRMMGPRQRCMYCLDSHGCDIEHFWPKANFPKRMFRWRNLLLCCTHCGRLKGSAFPRNGVRAALIDPTKEEPWQHLDFDPTTGNITAKFLLATDNYSFKGLQTINTLQLDRRESLAAGYKKTYRRLLTIIEAFLNNPNRINLPQQLVEEDDHGLLGWFFKGNGQRETALTRLREQHPQTWQDCLGHFEFQ